VWSYLDDHSTLNTEQTIVVANEAYTATIEKCYVAENERINYVIRLRSDPSSRRQEWNQRAWNDLFHLVVDPSGYFITLYTEKKDPSKVLLRKFLSSMLADIESVRSLPISSLLFRSLISYAAHDSYEGLQRFKSFSILPALVGRENRQIQPLRQGTYEPFLSKDRDLWIVASFTEERAHRQALRRDFDALHALEPKARGFAFERFLRALFDANGLKGSSSFRLVGEQIDGSFSLGDATYLIEAKWENKPLDVTPLFAFRSQVAKADWSRGLFISYSGFSEDACAAFSRTGQLNSIGMSGQDLHFILEGKMSLLDAIRAKLARAGEGRGFMVSVYELLLKL